MAAAVPFALKAGSMIGGSLLGKKLSGPSKGQQQALQQQQQGSSALTGVSQPLLQQGSQLAGQGAGYLKQAGNYYGNILNNRMAARESLSPEITQALDFYKGAESRNQRTLRGGSRDYAQAELQRQKTGQIAGMLPAARRDAAAGMAGLGGQAISGGTAMTGQGVNAASNAGYLNSGAFNNATTLRNQEGEGGKAWGGMLFDLAGSLFGKGKGGGKTPLPNRLQAPVNPLYKGPSVGGF